MIRTVLALVACTAGSAAADATVRGTVRVHRPDGVPPGPVLIYLVGFSEPAPPHAVEVQQNKRRFMPDLIAVTAGGSVSFPNGDPFLHNVFSPTSDRTFDLGSYKQGDTRTRTFPRPGVVDIYCNIHPEMSATLVILPNTRYAIADADGRFVISHVPPGTWSVFAFSRRASQPVSQPINVGSDDTLDVTLELDEQPRNFSHPNKYGEKYRPTTVYAPGA